MGLPRIIVLQSNSNKKYLDCRINNDAGVPGFLQFSGHKVLSPSVKFTVEKAKTGNGVFHVRSCYNNKYWTKYETEEGNLLITASADKPDEDQTQETCTLFAVTSDDLPGVVTTTTPDSGDESVDEPKSNSVHVSNYASPQGPTVRLYHVESKYYVGMSLDEKPFDACLFMGSSDPSMTDNCYDFTAIDWESLVILPKHVTFKSARYDNKYLGSTSNSGNRLFFDLVDPADYGIIHEVFTNDDGSVRIKSEDKGKFWCCNWNNYIETTSDGASTDESSFFWPIKVDDNTIVLRNKDGLFCGYSALIANATTMDSKALLVVEEPVVARSIYNVDFRVLDGRTYNKRIITMATGDAVNMTDDPTTVDLKMAYKATQTSTWKAGLSLKIGVTYSFEAGLPVIGDAGIEISAEFTGAYQWGEHVSTTNVLETVYKVSVPKQTRVKVSLIAAQASYDIPFSYDQEDVLTDGRRVTRTMHDGLYVGTNCYDFQYEAVEEELPE